MSNAAAEAAAALVAEDAGVSPDAPTEPEGVAGQETEADEFDFDPELPDDLVSEMNEPDLEDEAVYEEPDEESDEDEYEDPQVQAERNKRVKLEKKLAWLEQQKLKSDRKNWVEKDGKYFPLADVKGIAERASSRKEFARLAKAENERIRKLPGVQKLMAQQEKNTLTEQWGSPTAGPGPAAPAESGEAAQRVRETRERGSLIDTIKARLETGHGISNI